jgi:hypothetical protein
MGDVSNFEKRQIVCGRLATASVTKSFILLRVSRATDSKVMSAFMNHGKTISAKRNSGRKSTLTEKDRRALRRIVSKNLRTTACSTRDRTAVLNTYLEDPFFTKTVRHELHKSNIHRSFAVANPLITESDAQMRKRWRHNHKTWISENWNTQMSQMSSLSHCSLYQEECTFGEHPRKPGSNSGTQGRFCDGLGSNIVVQYSVGPIITLHGRIPAREYVDWLGIQVHPII